MPPFLQSLILLLLATLQLLGIPSAPVCSWLVALAACWLISLRFHFAFPIGYECFEGMKMLDCLFSPCPASWSWSFTHNATWINEMGIPVLGGMHFLLITCLSALAIECKVLLLRLQYRRTPLPPLSLLVSTFCSVTSPCYISLHLSFASNHIALSTSVPWSQRLGCLLNHALHPQEINF